MVHGGLLGVRGAADHAEAMDDPQHRRHRYRLYVDLYPFEATVASGGGFDAECVENIDIGGPAMIRSGGQEPRLCRGLRRSRLRSLAEVLEALKADGTTDLALRQTPRRPRLRPHRRL
jgi:phosphoribosylaminoimidazolecarboxamide formyltransferase/IMP cyclohydrolase